MMDKNKRENQEWKPDATTGEEALMNEERSLDIGESGQFAPGGYYNQEVSKPKRSALNYDDDIVPPGRH